MTDNQNNGLEGKLSENPIPELYLDDNNKIVSANNAALKELSYKTVNELNMCLREPGKRAIDRILYAKKSLKIESPTIEYLRIRTYDKKCLILCELETRIEKEKGLSTISFKQVRQEEKEIPPPKADICFRAPKNFIYTEEEGSDPKAKGWLEYVLKYCLSNLEVASYKSDDIIKNPLKLNHKVEINLKDVEQIGEGPIEFLTKGLNDTNLILSNPNQEVYKKFIEHGWSSILYLNKTT